MEHNYPKKEISPALVKILLVLLFVIWSNSFTAIRHLREVFTPHRLILARFLPAALICTLYLLARRSGREECRRILTGHPWRIAVMSIFGVAGYNFFLYTGQTEIKPGAAALITTLSPIFTLILSVVYLRVKPPLRRVLGVVIAFIGLVAVIKWGRIGLSLELSEFRYAGLATLAPVSWAIYTVTGKKLTGKYRPVTISYLSLSIGTIPFLILLDREFIGILASFSPTHWLALAHLSLLCTVAGYLIWNTGLKYLPATSVASFIYLNPPFAAFFGWALWGEDISIFFLAGSAVILFGLYLTQGKNNCPRGGK
ncbi:MAG: EamA family transporter [Candidatus Latescibacteria bacterium]|nr:EamA family transporter [bacterium]MBD3425330.1 EamA family transporter [Candidatus Latescibacterota bacterium]